MPIKATLGSTLRGTILILGPTGVGAALAQRLKTKSFALHFAARSKEACAKLEAEYPGSTYSLFDAADSTSIEAAVKEAGELAKTRGEAGLVGMAYCVGSIPLRSLKSAKPTDFTSCFMINTVGPAMAIKSSIPYLSKAPGGGSVVLFSSVAAQTGFPMHSIISAAKAGVEGLTRAAAAELSPAIRVNAIAPSLTDTPLAAKVLSSDSARQAMAKLHPLGRLGTPDDQAALASWLLDAQESSWVTGQVISVDGGRGSILK